MKISGLFRLLFEEDDPLIKGEWTLNDLYLSAKIFCPPNEFFLSTNLHEFSRKYDIDL